MLGLDELFGAAASVMASYGAKLRDDPLGSYSETFSVKLDDPRGAWPDGSIYANGTMRWKEMSPDLVEWLNRYDFTFEAEVTDEFREWAETTGVTYTIEDRRYVVYETKSGDVRKVVFGAKFLFDDPAHAMLFKLAWN